MLQHRCDIEQENRVDSTELLRKIRFNVYSIGVLAI